MTRNENQKPLSLRLETIRQLSDDKLAQINGGSAQLTPFINVIYTRGLPQPKNPF